MKKLSSSDTHFEKHIWPMIWCGGLGMIALIGCALVYSNTGKISYELFLIVGAIIALSLFIFKRDIFVLADEVWDSEDRLIVKRSGEEKTIYLSDIREVCYRSNTQVVILELYEPKMCGSRISFMCQARWPLIKNRDILNLKDRVSAIQG